MYPEDFRYTAEHEWLRPEDGDSGTVGITEYAQDQLGDVVYVELPEVGEEFERDEPFGVVESVKTVSDLYMPVDAEVTAVNPRLFDEPELVNASAHEEAWMVEIRLLEPGQVDELLTSRDYRDQIGE